MTRWILADYGEVIWDPVPAETILELADLAGMQADEFPSFDRRFYRCRLGLAKPDSAVYEAVSMTWAQRPSPYLFIHDRAENALAVTAQRLQAVRFTSAGELAGQLEDWETSTR